MTRLNHLLASAAMEPLSSDLSERFSTYLELLLKWNARLNLTAIRTEDEILRRHFVECIFCARALPPGIPTLLDFGSGAGFPGIPIALCRPDIAVTLAESQAKKAAFLQEAVRELNLKTTVYSGRAEALTTVFHAVAMRAVDKMDEAVLLALERLAPGGTLALMVGKGSSFLSQDTGSIWQTPIPPAECQPKRTLAGPKTRLVPLE